ncbi:MAG: STAS-like domain-containing protein [Armatimonadota bacterium]
MSDAVQISVYETVGSPLCVASDDGQNVHDRVATALRAGRSVVLSFLNVESLTSAFLNAAIGQLYGEFSEEQIKGHLAVQDMASDDLFLLMRVVDTAKAYFKDPAAAKAAAREILGEDDDVE